MPNTLFPIPHFDFVWTLKAVSEVPVDWTQGKPKRKNGKMAKNSLTSNQFGRRRIKRPNGKWVRWMGMGKGPLKRQMSIICNGNKTGQRQAKDSLSNATHIKYLPQSSGKWGLCRWVMGQR